MLNHSIFSITYLLSLIVLLTIVLHALIIRIENKSKSRIKTTQTYRVSAAEPAVPLCNIERIYRETKKPILSEDRMKPRMTHLRLIGLWRRLLVAILFAVCLALLLPGISEAHAILLRSDPAKDAVLSVAPDQVRLWFSETLNPAFSTAAVVNGANRRVDNRDAHISPSDATEMDVTLQPNLPPAVYVVIWRTDSNDDGHILSGSFLFMVSRPDGTVPTLSGGTIPGQNVFGASNLTGLYTGQLDGPTLFNLIMIMLVELGAVFWVGAQLWQLFVLQPATEEHEELSGINHQVQRRFEKRFSLPTLLLLLLANAGVLIGQAITITGGNVASAFAPTLLGELITSGRFGAYWLMRVIVIVLALRLSLYRLQVYRLQPVPRSRLVKAFVPWTNLILGLALFIAIAMSGHAAATSPNVMVFALVVDWFHLLAAALWVGGMMYIATSYLPILLQSSVAERAYSLVTMLPYYSPWALAGIIMMAVTGPFSATVHLNSWEQLLTTAYGRALVVKILLVGGLLLTSAIHVLLLRPRLKKEYKKYTYTAKRLQSIQAEKAPSHTVVGAPSLASTAAMRSSTDQVEEESPRATRLIAGQVRLREVRLAKKTNRMTAILRWEPVLGVAVLICVGLMNVFAGTLSPIAAAGQPQQTTGTSSAFTASVRTSDSKFTVTLTINPNRTGRNGFTVSVVDTTTGTPISNVGVSLYTTILDMDMGTDTVNLQPDGKGHFSGSGDLVMGGDWQIRIQLRTPDNRLHEAIVKFLTPY